MGAYTFDVLPDRVWAGLLQPDVLESRIPGCREFREVADDEYEIALRVGMGAVGGTYTGKVVVTDRDAPRSFRMAIDGRGSGGATEGSVLMTMRELDGSTEVIVDGDATASGAIARVGQRLLGSASRMMMDQFFACLKGKVE